MAKRKEKGSPVELDEVLLSPEAVAVWKQLAERLARFAVTAGIKPEELPTEKARLGPEGSLVVFVTMPDGRCEASVTIPKGHWAPRVH